MPQELAEAVAEKQKKDDVKTAELISRGTPVAPIRTGMDGGMNPAFQGKYKTSLVRMADGKVHTMVEERATGSVPAYTDSPREPPPAADSTVMTSARFGSQSSGNFFTRLFGGGRAEDEKPQAAAAQPAGPAPAAKPAPVRTANAAAKPAPKIEPKPESSQEARAQPAQPSQRPQPKPQQSAQDNTQAQAEPPKLAGSTSANAGGLILGAQPVVPAGSFESRWSAMR